MTDNSNFFDLLTQVDVIISKDATPAGVSTIVALSHFNKTIAKYVFTQLQSPAWIQPLRDSQVFLVPMSGGHDAGETVAPWPQGQYLKKMALIKDPKVQEQVLDIMLEVGATNNYFVHADFAEAALVMLAKLASQWAEHEAMWLSQGNKMHGVLEENFGKLISKVTKDGRPDVALRLAAELLAVLPDPEKDNKLHIRDVTERLVRESLEPAIRSDRYNYEQVLLKNIPDLAETSPFETLEMLCSLLEKAILYSQREGEKNKPHDATFVWRSAIEDNEQNKDYKIDCPLITAVRDTAEGICKDNPEKLSDVVLAVEKHGWNVFRRIGMYLLSVAPNPPANMVEDRLANEELLNDHGCRHEYFHLLKEKFRTIPDDGQKKILQMIDKGEDYADRDDLAPERKEQRKRQGQYRMLIAIKGDLPSQWKSRYGALEREFGKPSIPPDFNAYSSGGVWKGPQSPKKLDELTPMPVTELITFLKTWKPSGEWMTPTPDGLGAAIGELVTQQPERFIADIGMFMDPEIGRTYIRHMISGFCRLVESEKSIDYGAVLKLCRWVLDRRDDRPQCDLSEELKDGIDVDRSWRFARGEVVRFVEKSLGENAQLPFSLRKDVFDIIQPLADDPQPDEEYEKRSDMDPLTLSLNTIRGKALHALMAYAMWVNRIIREDVKAREGRNPNFSDMPEVQAILDRHLDPNVDPSRATRAVYGQWLPQMVYLGPDWVSQNMDRIFPREPAFKPLRDAAWQTYLVYGGQLRRNVVSFLRDIYCEEIKALQGAQFGEKSRESPAERLAEHAVIIYLWEEHNLEGGTLINLFFSVAPPALTTHVMDFIGRDVFRSKEVDPDIICRMRALWDWRVSRVGGYGEMNKEELATFGWWFTSEKFDAVWALRNLEETLKRTHINAANLQAIERLSELYVEHPAQVLRCLRLFVDANSDPWFFVSSRKRKGVWTILEQGMASPETSIRDQTEEIVHLLGSKGHLDYRELLKIRPVTGSLAGESRVVDSASRGVSDCKGAGKSE